MEYMWLLVKNHELSVGWTNASMKSTYALKNACKVFDKMTRMLEVYIYVISWYLNDKSMLAIHFNMNAHAIYVFLWWWHEVCIMMEIWFFYANYIYAFPTMFEVLIKYMKYTIPYLWYSKLWTPILWSSHVMCVSFLLWSSGGIRTQKT